MQGRKSQGPFNHVTGRGWVKQKDGQYKDALNKRTQVNLMLVESLGGVASGSRHRVRRLGRRAEGKGSVDRTKYGRTRISTKCFYTHHMQQLSKAAVVVDSRQVRRAVTMHKQKAWAAHGRDGVSPPLARLGVSDVGCRGWDVGWECWPR